MTQDNQATPAPIVDPGKLGSELNRKEVTLQFNRESGEFVTVIVLAHPKQREWLNKTYFDYREVEMDIEKECVIGNLHDFTIEPIAIQPMVVSEVDMDAAAQAKIERRFSIQDQILILGKALISSLPTEKVPEDLMEMISFIDQVQTDNQTRKQSYIDRQDVNYRTRKDDQTLLQRRMAGGAHELHGPRRII